MKFRNLSSVTLLISLTVSACSQPSIVKLWPNGVPNSIPNANYRERVIKSWGRDCYAGVTDPELQVFPAPEEKSTGTVVIICPGGESGS
jgi:hypothetical protein